MGRLRINLTSALAGLLGAIAVVWISAAMEQRAAERSMERMQHITFPPDALGGVVGWNTFGPGPLTLFLAVLVFAVIFPRRAPLAGAVRHAGGRSSKSPGKSRRPTSGQCDIRSEATRPLPRDPVDFRLLRRRLEQ
ncbi:MAG: hypothetical protein WDO73_18550 [Ignavibacteriota bacterium]